MIEYEYKVLNPGGNKTALVIGNQYNMEQKKIINQEILKNNTDIEQVGFIDKTKKRLDMAGGELCLNATRCGIYEYLKGETGEIKINSSGRNLIGGINDKKEVYVKIPINKKNNEIIEKKDQYNIVNLDGILLIVIDENNSRKYINMLKKDGNKTKAELKELMKCFETKEEAIGIILLEEKVNGTKIHPIIWVKKIDTLYYETACGSGSLAAAIYLKSIKCLNKFNIIQPSNYTIKVEFKNENNYIKEAVVIGQVIE